MTATWPSSPMVLKSVSMITFGGSAKHDIAPRDKQNRRLLRMGGSVIMLVTLLESPRGWKERTVKILPLRILKSNTFFEVRLSILQSKLLCGARRPPISIKVYDHRGDDHAAGDQPLNRFLCTELCQSGFQDGDHEHPEK